MKWDLSNDDNKRLGRCKVRYSGPSLKGMSARSYAQFQNLDPKGLVAATRQYLEHSVWTKFDRKRPLSYNQFQQVCCAINKALMAKTADFPFQYPEIDYELKHDFKEHTRYYLILKSIKYITVPHIASEHGNIYLFGKKTEVTIDNKPGIIGFRRHAIERFIERVPVVSKYSKLRSTTFVQIIDGFLIKPKIKVRMLVANATTAANSKVIGYFPLEYQSPNYWVALTFLLPDMVGTPEDVSSKLKELIAKYQ
jgi:hypothetical protein